MSKCYKIYLRGHEMIIIRGLEVLISVFILGTSKHLRASSLWAMREVERGNTCFGELLAASDADLWSNLWLQSEDGFIPSAETHVSSSFLSMDRTWRSSATRLGPPGTSCLRFSAGSSPPSLVWASTRSSSACWEKSFLVWYLLFSSQGGCRLCEKGNREITDLRFH